MKLDRIIGIILLLVIAALFIANKNYINDEEEIILLDSVAAVDLENNTIDYGTTTISDEDRVNEQVIKYTNTNNYTITITSNSISMDCTGNEEDVELVESNYNIKAYFSTTEDGELLTRTDVKKNKSVYIHIIANYEGNLPENEVTCDYSVNIISG